MNVRSRAFSVSLAKNMAIQKKYRQQRKKKTDVCVYVEGGRRLLPQSRFTHHKFPPKDSKTISCCYSLRMLIQQYAEDLNYNLMWRNSNNTSGWPENQKNPAKLFGKHLPLVRYAAAAEQIVYMPHPDTWKRSRPFTSFSILNLAL